MKRIKPNSCYASTHSHNGVTYYSLYHYTDIWDDNEAWGDGFSVDSYIISPNDIYFEDASWNGKIAVEQESFIPISAQLYNRWHNLITKTRESIVLQGKSNCRPLQGKPNIGDYLFYHYTRDEEDEYDYDFSYFSKIVEVGDDFYKIEDIVDLDIYNFSCKHKIRTQREDYEIERILESQIIDAATCTAAENATMELIERLRNEIKECLFEKDIVSDGKR